MVGWIVGLMSSSSACRPIRMFSEQVFIIDKIHNVKLVANRDRKLLDFDFEFKNDLNSRMILI